MFAHGNCGFLCVLLQTAVSTANSKLALFFDWLFYQPDKDNIMNIGNAILFNYNIIFHKKGLIHRGYYTVARRYEFYVLVAKTISHSFAALTCEILFLPLKHEIHIFELTCNVLFIT